MNTLFDGVLRTLGARDECPACKTAVGCERHHLSISVGEVAMKEMESLVTEVVRNIEKVPGLTDAPGHEALQKALNDEAIVRTIAIIALFYGVVILPKPSATRRLWVSTLIATLFFLPGTEVEEVLRRKFTTLFGRAGAPERGH